MKHFKSPTFRECYNKLPAKIKSIADKNFSLLKEDLNHPSLHVKKVASYWSVRVGRRYRALAVEVENGLLWFWIGTHTEYDRMIKK